MSNLIPNLKAFDERLLNESQSRYKAGEKILKFGVSFLDDALSGIYTDDLVVMGAKTGLGKTQLAMHIALANAKEGRNVVYFALEAAEYEIERRIKYQAICDRFFSMNPRPPIYLNYMDWYYGKFKSELATIEKEIEERVSFPRLRVYYRDRDFGVSEFQRVFLAVKETTDLVIVDHLHYFDHDDPNENKAVKEIVKKIKDTTDITNIPVVLISHVRKTDKRLKSLVPDIEDFHGSSDIGKIATKAFCISPGEYDAKNNTKYTLINIMKCRTDSSRKDWTACIPYNLTAQRYQNEYILGRMNFDATEFEPLTKDWPFWAKNAKQQNRSY